MRKALKRTLLDTCMVAMGYVDLTPHYVHSPLWALSPYFKEAQLKWILSITKLGSKIFNPAKEFVVVEGISQDIRIDIGFYQYLFLGVHVDALGKVAIIETSGPIEYKLLPYWR